MIKFPVLYTLFFLMLFARGQNGNVIIQVNNKLIISGLLQVKVKPLTDSFSYYADYVPGMLNISDKAWEKIEQDSLGKFTLSFQYQTFKGNKSNIVLFEAELSKSLLNKSYLIINVYDFRNRKYRKWYGPYTEKEYLIELAYPGSPFYPQYK